ncbi:CoA-binding protein [Amycolatopsis pithecellobii]|uniref:CoA-binding protein n=1 Tax=Amycolatopsis pithecellobii TaxID=664692 RepID=A0A6N7YTQ6_9PSEU|nr:CoA-binding protein [Amycolatopsis pithecellobii]MTD55312.1 CoA-binding protein [Amycolatopsis pithecellobii]
MILDTSVPAGAVRTESPLTWTPPTARERQAILARTRSVTIIGASDNPARPSFFVATYLLSSSRYRVHFVNPRLKTLLGQPVYASLADVPEVDLVSVFRKHADLPDVAEEVIKAGARTLWLQLGLWHEPVAQRAAEAGLDTVMNRCVKIEHARFAGGLHLAGFNTGVVSSRRQSAP